MGITDREYVVKALKKCRRYDCDNCAEEYASHSPWDCVAYDELVDRAITLIKEQQKDIKALRLLIEWAQECGFGCDNFSDEYDLYKDEIQDMKYIDKMIHVAKRTLEDHGAFEEDR